MLKSSFAALLAALVSLSSSASADPVVNRYLYKGIDPSMVRIKYAHEPDYFGKIGNVQIQVQGQAIQMTKGWWIIDPNAGKNEAMLNYLRLNIVLVQAQLNGRKVALNSYSTDCPIQIEGLQWGLSPYPREHVITNALPAQISLRHNRELKRLEMRILGREVMRWNDISLQEVNRTSTEIKSGIVWAKKKRLHLELRIPNDADNGSGGKEEIQTLLIQGTKFARPQPSPRNGNSDG